MYFSNLYAVIDPNLSGMFLSSYLNNIFSSAVFSISFSVFFPGSLSLSECLNQLLYPFVCWWTSRLLPYSSYCKQCCGEHWGTCVFFSYGFEEKVFLRKSALKEIKWCRSNCTSRWKNVNLDTDLTSFSKVNSKWIVD